jgi:hypothetical protein
MGVDLGKLRELSPVESFFFCRIGDGSAVTSSGVDQAAPFQLAIDCG